MYGLDVRAGVLPEVPSGADVFDPLTGRIRRYPAVVDTHRIRCRRCEFAPIVCNEGTRDYRPSACMAGRFAGEVSGVELGEGCVEVVALEHHECHEPFVR